MRESMKAITDKSISLENREVAFDNFEQLIENLDNANNIAALGLWEPLVGQLGSEEKEMRIMAAWCIGTAVQNNSKAQDMVCFPFIVEKYGVSFEGEIADKRCTVPDNKRHSNTYETHLFRPRHRRSQEMHLRLVICSPELPAWTHRGYQVFAR